MLITGIVAHAWRNLITHEAETGGSWVQSHPGLHNEFSATEALSQKITKPTDKQRGKIDHKILKDSPRESKTNFCMLLLQLSQIMNKMITKCLMSKGPLCQSHQIKKNTISLSKKHGHFIAELWYTEMS